MDSPLSIMKRHTYLRNINGSLRHDPDCKACFVEKLTHASYIGIIILMLIGYIVLMFRNF